MQLLTLLRNSPGSCPMEQLQLRVQETDRVCCPDGCNGQLVPEMCTPDCAVVVRELITIASLLSEMFVGCSLGSSNAVLISFL